MSHADCKVENNYTLNLKLSTNNIDITSLVGVSEIHLFIYGRNNVIRLNGIRLDICQMLGSSQRKSLVSMLYKGIMQTDNNLPKKCPFKRVSSGINQEDCYSLSTPLADLF